MFDGRNNKISRNWGKNNWGGKKNGVGENARAQTEEDVERTQRIWKHNFTIKRRTKKKEKENKLTDGAEGEW